MLKEIIETTRKIKELEDEARACLKRLENMEGLELTEQFRVKYSSKPQDKA